MIVSDTQLIELRGAGLKLREIAVEVGLPLGTVSARLSGLGVRKPPKTRDSVTADFWGQVDKSGGREACWPWTAASVDGYGRVRFSFSGEEPQSRLAHRVAYHLAKGAIPDGLIVRHSCDNPACCNPEHLLTGTIHDNTAIDAVERDRLSRGETHSAAKLTAKEVAEVRNLYAGGGVSQRELGERYGIHQATVSAILRRKSWRRDTPRRNEPLLDSSDTPTPRERAVSMLKHGASFDHAARVLDLTTGDLDLLLWNGLGGDVQSEAVAA